MILNEELATVEITFDPPAMLREIVIEIINEPGGPETIAGSVLGGIEQLFAEEQLEILTAIIGELELVAFDLREGKPGEADG